MAFSFDCSRVFIGGRWLPGTSGQTLDLLNPSDGSSLGEIARGNAEDIDLAVSAARDSLDGE